MTDRNGLFGASLPIVQAPMAQASTTELAISVSRAGGLGSIAAGTLSVDQIHDAVRKYRQATDQPFNVNLFAMQFQPPDPAKLARARELAARLEQETGADRFTFEPPPLPPSLEEQLAAIVEERVPVVSFTFGVPTAEQLIAVRESGATVVGTATSVEEATHLAALGFDAVVAQGIEAGGHRGTFLDPASPGIPMIELVEKCVEAVGIPVIAAGGIMNGRDIAAALDQGASAVQMGTAFLCCPETALLPAWRDAILEGRPTVLTRTLTGKPARAIRNRLTEFMDEHETELPEFPYIAVATARLRAWAAHSQQAEYLPLLAGMGTGSARSLPAAELIATLVAEMAVAD